MADVRVTWVLPVTRDSGRPLLVSEIREVLLEVSADAGANFVALDTYLPDVLETVLTDLEPGEWLFRGSVFDTAGRQSRHVTASILVPDTTAPGPLTLTLTLA